MQEALRTYLELATGLTDASRKKVKKAVKEAVGKGGATAEQIRALTGDLIATNAANRDALSKLVRFEVDRALGVVGLATAEEVAELTARVRDLERQLRAAESRSSTPESAPAPAKKAAERKATDTAPAPAKKAAEPAPATAKKAPPARSRVAKKSTATPATTTAAKKTTAATKTTAAKKTATAKTTSAGAPAKRTAAKRVAKKAQP